MAGLRHTGRQALTPCQAHDDDNLKSAKPDGTLHKKPALLKLAFFHVIAISKRHDH